MAGNKGKRQAEKNVTHWQETEIQRQEFGKKLSQG
jgi:hypothetical protein